MLVIGLTGGIGSGKSTVARLFQAKDITIIDTDQLARELTAIGQDALNKIVIHFGKDILLSDGLLNRKRLRHIIFSDRTERVWLEKLLHPLIRAEMKKQIHSAQSPYCIVVIPLLFETEPNPLINRILLVDATEEHQLQRIQQRDNCTMEEAKAIFAAQVTREHRLAHANDIIYNTGSIEELHHEVDKWHGFYLALCKTI